MKGRLTFYTIIFVVMFVAIIIRLFYWQVIRGKELSQIARSQYQRSDLTNAPRGDILANDGSHLVTNEDVYTVFVEPDKLESNRAEIAAKVAEIIVSHMEFDDDLSDYDEKTDVEMDITQEVEKEAKPPKDKRQVLLEETERIENTLSRSDANWLPLARDLNKVQKTQIEAYDFSGIGFDLGSKRSYPEASMAAHLLGFVGKDENGDDVGYFGLEGFYDLLLKGKPGVLSEERDAFGRTLASGDFSESHAISGANLVTYVDKYVQIVIEMKLSNAIEKYGAKEGSVTVLDPKTGGVIAMAASPSFDPGKYSEYGNDYFRNPIVSDGFEPGSIFKVVVMASALDAQVVKPDTKCDICTGPYQIGKYSIGTWDDKYYPESTMADVIKHSDNVGMVFTASRLGKDRMFDYLSGFGIGKLTEIDLQGEVTPKLREKNTWGDIDLAITSFGQGVAVTPIQMLAAVSTIANDGIRITPKVVEKIQGQDWEQYTKTNNETRIISKKAADEITLMMVEAAKSGEAKWTYREGFGVAGKTGTAQIPIAGNYDAEKTIASFVGFAPYDDPKFVMLVTLVEPQSSPWASETAAPLWYSIAGDLFAHYKMQPKN